MSTFHKLSTRTLQAHWHWYFGKSSPLPSDEHFALLSTTLIIDPQSETNYLALCVCAAQMDFPDENSRATWLISRMWNVATENKSLAWQTVREVLTASEPAPAVCTAPRRPRPPRKKRVRQARSNRKF